MTTGPRALSLSVVPRVVVASPRSVSVIVAVVNLHNTVQCTVGHRAKSWARAQRCRLRRTNPPRVVFVSCSVCV